MVCLKQIPDPADPYELDDRHHLIRPESQIIDDTDRYGVEMGLQLAEGSGGQVKLLTMGPGGGRSGIRQGLAMGADEAVLIEDGTLAGADALVTTKVLAAAISASPFDLVIAGTESTDGYAGVVPQMLAEMLEVPALTYATKVEVADGMVTIHRQTASGYDVVAAPTPVVVSVTAGVVEPRYPSFKGIMEAKKKPIHTPSLAELGVSPQVSQKVVTVTEAPGRTAGVKIEDDGTAHIQIADLLAAKKVI